MCGIKQREHSVESQGVVIAFYIDARHMLSLCASYPQLEEEMWKRAAVTAAKLVHTKPPHDYRHRTTRDLRIAFQGSLISSPIQRRHRGIYGDEEVYLETANDHVFFLRTHTHKTTPRGDNSGSAGHRGRGDSSRFGGAKGMSKVASLQECTTGLPHDGQDSVISGPNRTVVIRETDVAIKYFLEPATRSNSFVFRDSRNADRTMTVNADEIRRIRHASQEVQNAKTKTQSPPRPSPSAVPGMAAPPEEGKHLPPHNKNVTGAAKVAAGVGETRWAHSDPVALPSTPTDAGGTSPSEIELTGERKQLG